MKPSGGDLFSLLCEDFFHAFAGDAAEEFSRFTPRYAVDELDTSREGLVGHLVVGDVLSNDLLQLSLFLGVLGDEGGGFLRGND